MIILSLVNAPQKTKGYASRYLIEISPSVYIGNLDSKTRDELWDYVRGNVGKTGYAILAYSKNNAQGYEIYTQNEAEQREIVDFDGLKMILKKNAESIDADTVNKTGWSKYSYYRRSKSK